MPFEDDDDELRTVNILRRRIFETTDRISQKGWFVVASPNSVPDFVEAILSAPLASTAYQPDEVEDLLRKATALAGLEAFLKEIPVSNEAQLALDVLLSGIINKR